MASQDDLKSIPQRWAAAWSKPDPSTWLSLYTPTASYIDHSFFIRRTGTSILKRHFEIWKHSIPDFVMEVESEMPASSKKGTLIHDFPSKKASGKKFSFSGAVDLIIDGESGLIEEVNEWYSWNFDNSKDVSEYHTLEDS